MANSLIAGVRRRDPEGFEVFCAALVVAKVAHWDAKAECRPPRHANVARDFDQALAAVREWFSGGN